MGLVDDWQEIESKIMARERNERAAQRKTEEAQRKIEEALKKFKEPATKRSQEEEECRQEEKRREEERRRQEEKRRVEEWRREEEEKRNRKIGYGILLVIVSAVFIITFIIGIVMEAVGSASGGATAVSCISGIMGWVSVPCLIYHCDEDIYRDKYETKTWVAVVSWILSIVALIMVIVLICS